MKSKDVQKKNEKLKLFISNNNKYVRISKHKKIFPKVYTPNQFTKMLKYIKIMRTTPTTQKWKVIEVIKSRVISIVRYPIIVEKNIKRNGLRVLTI